MCVDECVCVCIYLVDNLKNIILFYFDLSNFICFRFDQSVCLCYSFSIDARNHSTFVCNLNLEDKKKTTTTVYAIHST